MQIRTILILATIMYITPVISAENQVKLDFRHQPDETASQFASRALPVLRSLWQTIQNDSKNLDSLANEWLTGQDKIVAQLQDNIAFDLTLAKDSLSQARIISEIHDFAELCRSSRQYIDLYQPIIASTEATLNAADFGAVGDSVTDNTTALNQAIATVIAKQISQLIIPAGDYRLAKLVKYQRTVLTDFTGDREVIDAFRQKRGQGEAHLVIRDAKNLHIKGEGKVRIILGNLLGTGIHLDNCENVILENITVDADPMPIVHGQIEAVDSTNTFIARMNQEFALSEYLRAPVFKGPLARFFSQEWENGRPTHISVVSHTTFKTIESLGDCRYKFTVSSPANTNHLRQGLHLMLSARTYGTPSIKITNSARCRLLKLVSQASNSMFIVANGNRQLFIEGCRTEPKAGYYSVSAADGLFLFENLHGGLVARNSLEGLGDDFLNIGFWLRTMWNAEQQTIRVPLIFWNEQLPRPGHRLAFLRTGLGQTAFSEEAFIESVQIVSGKDTPFADGFYEITLDRAVPAQLSTLENPHAKWADFVAVAEVFAHGQVFRENYFGHSLSRVLPGGQNMLFENNIFDDHLAWQLFFLGIEGKRVSKHGHGGECQLPRNHIYQNNQIKMNYPKRVFGIHSRLTGEVDNNANISHLFFRDNILETNTTAAASSKDVVFAIQNVDHIVIENNRLITNAKPAVQAIEIGAGVTNIQIHNNQLEGYLSSNFDSQ